MSFNKIYKGTNDITSTLTKAYKGNTLIWENTPPGPTLGNFITFYSDEPRTITPRFSNASLTLQYSIDKGITWTNITTNTPTTSAKEILFRGQTTGWKSLTTVANENIWLFSGEENNKCYGYGDLMFLFCATLGDTTPPEMLDQSAFRGMFKNVKCLVKSPECSANTYVHHSFNSTWSGCINLEIAPIFKGSILGSTGTFTNAFLNCNKLTYIRLDVTTIQSSAFNQWVSGISTIGILEKAGTQFASSGVSTYPTTWTQVQI